MKILVTGPQGSGKTTQAEILAKKLDLCLVKTGDLFRGLAKEDTERGREIKKQMVEGGELINDALTVELVREKLEDGSCEGGFVFDGYPRTIHQIEMLDPGFDLVFDLEISNEVATARMLKRGRADDTPEVINKRLDIYYHETIPVINYYKRLEKLVVINGEESIAEVAEEIQRKLENVKK